MEKVKSFFTKALEWIKAHLVIVIAVVVAILVVALLLNVFIKTPKKVVKAYIKAYDKGNVDKIVKLVDLKGISALGYSFSNDFDEDDYEDFLEKYDDTDIDKEDRKDFKDDLEDEFDDRKDSYKSFKMKLEEFKSVKKIGKDFYVVKAKISVKAKPDDDDVDEIDSSDVTSFVVYKNKIVRFSI